MQFGTTPSKCVRRSGTQGTEKSTKKRSITRRLYSVRYHQALFHLLELYILRLCAAVAGIARLCIALCAGTRIGLCLLRVL